MSGTIELEPTASTSQPVDLFDIQGRFLDIAGGSANGRELFAALEDIRIAGRYEIISKLGNGASGTVYQVMDHYIKREVAVKVSKPHPGLSRDQFLVEAQSSGQLNHPNIVSIYDAIVHGDYCFLTMEYVQGANLEGFCRQDNLLPVKRVVEIMLSLCNALEYAHSKGVIHKDIKPSNIMLDKFDVLKVTDFGVAQLPQRTVPFGIFGTPSYMSPEQLRDEPLKSASDIFSLGCVFYELLTGVKAFPGDSSFSVIYKVINDEPANILCIRPDLAEVLEKVTKKALAKDVEERYPSCLDLAYDLRVALRGLSGANKDERVTSFVDFIRLLPFFRDFTKEQVEGLLSTSDIVRIPKGKIILSEGDVNDTFYIILSGRAKVVREGSDIGSVEAGECLGEMACIGGQPRVADVVADVDCILMKISAFLLDKSHESIRLLLYKTLATTLVQRLSKTP
jgi:serine/threonine-protein kinase